MNGLILEPVGERPVGLGDPALELIVHLIEPVDSPRMHERSRDVLRCRPQSRRRSRSPTARCGTLVGMSLAGGYWAAQPKKMHVGSSSISSSSVPMVVAGSRSQ